MAWMGSHIGWDRVSRNHQGGANSVRQIDGDLDMVPACQLRKGQWLLSALLSGRKLLLLPSSRPDD